MSLSKANLKSESTLYSCELIKQCIKQKLITYKVSQDVALDSAEILLEGDLRGYPLHGISRLNHILEGLNNGTISSTKFAETIRETECVMVKNGYHTLGHHVAKQGIYIAIEKAQKYGIGICGIINTTHIGVLGYYSHIGALNNCITLVISNTSPAVSIPGSSQKILGTNPISFAIPSNKYPPIISDFSTSAVSRGKIYEFLNKQKHFTEVCGVDLNGKPTADPEKILKGALSTFGDIKGTHLSLFFSLLCGPLIGGVLNVDVVGTRYMDKSSNKGDFIMCINVSSFTDINIFKRQVDRQIEIIQKTSSPRYRVPGHRSLKQREILLETGISVSNQMKGLLFNE